MRTIIFLADRALFIAVGTFFGAGMVGVSLILERSGMTLPELVWATIRVIGS